MASVRELTHHHYDLWEMENGDADDCQMLHQIDSEMVLMKAGERVAQAW